MKIQKAKSKMQNDNGKIKNHPDFAKLLSLGFPSDDYAVFGSGPMWVNGLKDNIGDIDLIARRNVLVKAESIGVKESAPHGGAVIKINNTPIEVYEKWGPGEWDIDQLINSADVIEGVRFVSLDNVVKWKKIYGRPKDIEHVKIIESFLEK